MYQAVLYLGLVLLGGMALTSRLEAQAKELAPTRPPLPAPDVADVAYGPHERHRLDLWLAKSPGPTAWVVHIHGGGWHGGGKEQLPREWLEDLRGAGISVASINYRFTRMALAPAPLHDGARAVQFLRHEAARWNLDPARVGAIGTSAGGCTTLWLAYHDDLADPGSADPIARESSRIRAGVGLSPQVSIDSEEMVGWVGEQVLNHPMVARAVGAKNKEELRSRYREYRPVMRECSPIAHVSADDPPVLISNPSMAPLPATDAGSAIHHAIFGVRLKERADAAGVVCVLRLESAGDDPAGRPAAFLIRHLAAGGR